MESGLAGFTGAILDFDYTIVDLFDAVDLFELRRELRQLLKGLGFGIDGIRSLPVGLLNRAVQHYKGDEREKVRKWDEASKVLCRYETEAAPRAVIPPDTVPFLEELRSAGLKVAIVSSNCENAIVQSLKSLGIDGYFHSIIGRDRVRWEMKPSPLGVEIALRQIGVEPAYAFGVGDSTVDLISFSRAGVMPLGITGGISSRSELAAAGAKAVVSRLSEVKAALIQATRYTSSASES